MNCALRKIIGTDKEADRMKAQHDQAISLQKEHSNTEAGKARAQHQDFKVTSDIQRADLTRQVENSLSLNAKLSGEVRQKERESALEKQKRIDADSQRVYAEQMALNADNERVKALNLQRVAEQENARAQSATRQAQLTAANEAEARKKAELEKEHVLGFVKIQSEQHELEQRRLAEQVRLEKDKTREAERKKAALIATIQSELNNM
jgi:hypothetical protein